MASDPLRAPPAPTLPWNGSRFCNEATRPKQTNGNPQRGGLHFQASKAGPSPAASCARRAAAPAPRDSGQIPADRRPLGGPDAQAARRAWSRRPGSTSLSPRAAGPASELQTPSRFARVRPGTRLSVSSAASASSPHPRSPPRLPFLPRLFLLREDRGGEEQGSVSRKKGSVMWKETGGRGRGRGEEGGTAPRGQAAGAAGVAGRALRGKQRTQLKDPEPRRAGRPGAAPGGVGGGAAAGGGKRKKRSDAPPHLEVKTENKTAPEEADWVRAPARRPSPRAGDATAGPGRGARTDWARGVSAPPTWSGAGPSSSGAQRPQPAARSGSAQCRWLPKPRTGAERHFLSKLTLSLLIGGHSHERTLLVSLSFALLSNPVLQKTEDRLRTWGVRNKGRGQRRGPGAGRLAGPEPRERGCSW